MALKCRGCLYVFCVFLVFVFCTINGFRSYIFGNDTDSNTEWFKPAMYLSDLSNNKTGFDRNVSTVLKNRISKIKLNNLNHQQLTIINKTLFNSVFHEKPCTERHVSLSQVRLPVTGLVSFPGSGNTWLRHLIQQMTGIGTSSVYCDQSLRRNGFPYECVKNKSRTIAVKTHAAKDLPLFKKVILLIRNPYDALMAYASFVRAGHTAQPRRNILIAASNRMFNGSLRWYVSLTRDTLNKFKGPVHVVQYEKLKSNMTYELRKLATFLDVDVSDRDIHCTVKMQEGNFHRQTYKMEHIDKLRTVYNKEKRVRLRESTRTAEQLLKDYFHTDFYLGGTVEKMLNKTSR